MSIPTRLNPLSIGNKNYIKDGLVFLFDASKYNEGFVTSIKDEISKTDISLRGKTKHISSKEGLDLSGIYNDEILKFPENILSDTNTIEVVLTNPDKTKLGLILFNPYNSMTEPTGPMIGIGLWTAFTTPKLKAVGNTSWINLQSKLLTTPRTLTFLSNSAYDNGALASIIGYHSHDVSSGTGIWTYRDGLWKLYSIRIYNRDLSQTEIIHNYHVDKFKFNIS